MARPLKDGLTYFSHDVDMSSDMKILAMEQRFGDSGYAFYNKILERIYASANGYIEAKEEWQRLVWCKALGKTPEQFTDMLNFALEVGLFDKNIFNENGHVTSNGIEKRRKEVIKDREYQRNNYHNKKDSLEKELQNPPKDGGSWAEAFKRGESELKNVHKYTQHTRGLPKQYTPAPYDPELEEMVKNQKEPYRGNPAQKPAGAFDNLDSDIEEPEKDKNV